MFISFNLNQGYVTEKFHEHALKQRVETTVKNLFLNTFVDSWYFGGNSMFASSDVRLLR
jgi:hypothetical protein